MLKDKVAFITGAGRGIGAATAKLFAMNGAKIALLSRTQSELNEVQKEIGVNAISLACDIGREAEVLNAFQSVKEKWGPVDILINNAGTIHGSPFIEHTLTDWEKTFSTNVTGSFLCAREAFKHMAGRSGVIINVSSLSGIRGVEKFPNYSAYVASKHAVVGLTEALAVEGKPLGIRVNAIAPGAVNTAMLQKAASHLKSDTNPEDIAKVLLFLASPESKAVNGSILEIFTNA